jgi:hypothetical protein
MRFELEVLFHCEDGLCSVLTSLGSLWKGKANLCVHAVYFFLFIPALEGGTFLFNEMEEGLCEF